MSDSSMGALMRAAADGAERCEQLIGDKEDGRVRAHLEYLLGRFRTITAVAETMDDALDPELTEAVERCVQAALTRSNARAALEMRLEDRGRDPRDAERLVKNALKVAGVGDVKA